MPSQRIDTFILKVEATESVEDMLLPIVAMDSFSAEMSRDGLTEEEQIVEATEAKGILEGLESSDVRKAFIGVLQTWISTRTLA